MKKVLVTGASGFVGSFLIEEALKRDYDVFAGLRESSDRQYLSNSEITFFYCDFSDKRNIQEALQQYDAFDCIIHNAGVTKSCCKADFERVNYTYTKNFIEAIKESGLLPSKFIYISSLAAQGPGQEGTQIPLKISDFPQPISAYGRSKLNAENNLKASGLNYLIFRPTGVYGPREQDYLHLYKSIKMGIETFVGTRQQHVTFIYVKDLVRLIFDAVASGVQNKTYFVSDYDKYTTESFNKIIKHLLKKKTVGIVFPKCFVKWVAFIVEKYACLSGKVPVLNTDKFLDVSCDNWLCDCSDLQADFDFTPHYNLQKGLEECLLWYQEEKYL